ncbi:PHP domain-containing protein [Anaerotalea alkaliphila]|uniref:PHP domain-containing protein n=1 Tax=Anaerotalea alkaliphila TaxID=2662126 RepID=A0A7X5KP62_9FIRM|nr:PHP domain-containing protein [Anaerotalea alkaliphila]NDL67592.1 PHP domain-containing protein [Anaerotalea alkaliphila]
MKTIDLHTHTTASDGTLTPAELVKLAKRNNLAAMAITDHDTIEGLLEARKFQEENLHCYRNLEIISGIEFSTVLPDIGQDIHILGLYINEQDPAFVERLKDLVDSREARNHRMVDKLQRLGVPLTMEDVVACATDGVVTRAHFGKAMVQKGVVSSMEEAFEVWIGNGQPGFIPREKTTPKDAIRLILNCGGIPVLAHPNLYGLDDSSLDSLVGRLKDLGLMGIEGLYPLYGHREERFMAKLAQKYGLFITGGSDFHGANKEDIKLGTGRGNMSIPYALLEPLKRYHESYFGS